MRNKKNNLDEMQEQSLLKIESHGAWIAFWMLAVSILIQFALRCEYYQIAGESCVLTILSIYLVINSLKNGIWDRYLKATFKSNLIISIVAGVVLCVAVALRNYIMYSEVFRAVKIGAILFVRTFVICLIAMEATRYLYKIIGNKLEKDSE